MGSIRAVYRLLLFMLHTSWLILQYRIGTLFTKDHYSLSLRIRRQWLNKVPALMGIHTIRSGNVPNETVLYMSNHRSYLDPILFLRYADGMPLSKAEVRRWPLIGYAAAASGSLFVTREDRNSREGILEVMLNALENGRSVINYPEGTTSDAASSLPFKTGGFLLAERANVAIVPVAVEYEERSDAWIGNDRFLRHFFQVFRKKKIRTAISFGPPIKGKAAQDLKSECKTWIDQELERLRNAFKSQE